MANGDITLPVAKTIPGVPLGEITISVFPAAFMSITFFEGDGGGPTHVVRISNASVTGFDFSAGVFTDNLPRALAGYLTTILGVLFIGNATTLNQRRTALVQRLIADGVLTGFVAGNVG